MGLKMKTFFKNYFLIAVCCFILLIPFLTLAAGRDETCATDADCAEGDCRYGRCYCTIGTTPTTCAGKVGSGNTCTADRSIRCLSGVCESGHCKNSAAGASCLSDAHCAEGECAGGKCACTDYICVVKTETESASAEEITPEIIRLEKPISEISAPKIIGNIIKTVLAIVGALALGMFVYGGFTWLTSGGSPDRVKKGKDILIWAVIGLVVIFASYTLVDFLLRALGL